MPRLAACSSFSCEEALPITNAPAIFASWTAAEPMPEPTELIITISPGWSRPRVKSMCQDVANAICVRGRLLVGQPFGYANEMARAAGELLGVARRPSRS